MIAPPDPDEVAAFVRARATVLARIGDACARAGRTPADVTLVAVSKTVPAERVRAAVAAGLTVLGENRVQEAAEKQPTVPGATWHLVGPLQANKVRRAIGVFDTIEAVDSLDLARRIDRIAREERGLPREGLVDPNRRQTVFLQVNVDEDASKAGFSVDELRLALPELLGLEALHVAGLMTIGRIGSSAEEARPTFSSLRRLSDECRALEPRLGGALSMGMSEDYAVAVEEGSTHVRVGRALFGERPAPAATP